MPRFVWDRALQQLVEVVEGPRPAAVAPMVMRDIPEYKSPVGSGLITSRSHRREDLKRSGSREVDPSEFKAVYRNPAFAAKRNLPFQQD
jgi:hypothetical protein